MSAAHMPGPWIVTEEMGSNIIRGAEEERGEAGYTYKWRDYVASTWGGPHEANARLIAAAPDLLAELQNALQALEAHGFTQQAAKARAAIAKATGGAQ